MHGLKNFLTNIMGNVSMGYHKGEQFQCIKLVRQRLAHAWESTETLLPRDLVKHTKLSPVRKWICSYWQRETNIITEKHGQMTTTHTYNWFQSVVALHRPGENPMESKNQENGREKTLHEGKTQTIKSGYKTYIYNSIHTHTYTY